ncbi:hypothetical protein INT48_009518 [Thamnidium elegans]|uniref:Uncharacterized protein n=1 Tax=Thamnidium elegans TaxID=101142 RepID=A0A8H7SZL7_9FUNG|nr:hypothetical protein INT48_009518 [Thamnidium elegans]
MTKRALNDPDTSEPSKGSKNKRKKSDEERGLPLQKYTFSRKCKVSTLLKEPFKIYGQLFRTTTVEFMIFRRDTMHFLNFLVLNRAASDYNLATFPDITAPILWSHSYKLMVNDTKNSNS